MTANLIPQDELTLDLLAKILAKMYLHSLNGGDDVSVEAMGSDESTPRPDFEDQRQNQATLESAQCDESLTVDVGQHDEVNLLERE